MGNEMQRPDDSLTAILEKYADTVLRLCLVYMRNRPDAEDAFQNVFLKLCRYRPVFQSEEHVKAWLITVASNECKNQLRSFWRRNRVCLEDATQPVRDPEKRDVVAAVIGLPAKYRNVVYLHYYENYKIREIADLLGEKESTVKTRLMRGRALLRQNLLKGGFDDHE